MAYFLQIFRSYIFFRLFWTHGRFLHSNHTPHFRLRILYIKTSVYDLFDEYSIVHFCFALFGQMDDFEIQFKTKIRPFKGVFLNKIILRQPSRSS